MTIQEAIEVLTEFAAEVGGDVEIVSMQEIDGAYALDYGRDFDLIDIPINEDADIEDAKTETKTVCALMEPYCEHCDSDGPVKPRLTLVK